MLYQERLIILIAGLFVVGVSPAQENNNWVPKETGSFNLNFYGLNNAEVEVLSMFCEVEFDRITNSLNHAPTEKITIDFKETSNEHREFILVKKEILARKCNVNLAGEQNEIPGELCIKISQLVIGDMLEQKGLKKVPEWFFYGGAAYFADDSRVANLRVEKPDHEIKLDDLTGLNAMITGWKVFKCMENKYGKVAIVNTFNLTRIFMNIEKAIDKSLSEEYQDFLTECELDLIM